MNKMSLLECESPIDSFPEEVLCQIFDFLDLKNVKNASITCRRWYNIISSSTYMKRFKFLVQFPKITWYPEIDGSNNCPVKASKIESFGWYPEKDNEQNVKCKMLMKEVIDIVNRTGRCYRNLHLIVGTYMIEEFETLWTSLHPKFTEQIYSLELTFEHSYTPNVVGMISNGMNRMSKLRSLSLSGCRETNSYTILVNYSVKHLKVDYVSDITFAVPELQSFEGALSALREPYEGVEGGPLTKLKNVTLTGHGDEDCHGELVVYRLAHIETLRLKYEIDEYSTFTAMCDRCTALRELYFDYQAYGDQRFFRNLSQLINLRRLSLDIRIHTESFDLSALTQLTHLKLENTDFDGISSIRLPKSIKFLSVQMFPDDEILINSITATLIQLQKLCLIYPNPRLYTSSFIVNKETLKSLHRLMRLEELVFVNAKFALSAFLDGISPVHRLRKLLLVNCNFDRNHLCALKQMCPNLKHLESTSKYNFDIVDFD